MKFIVLLLCFLLFGCNANEDLKSNLDEVFISDNKKEDIRLNNYSTYIEYYVPSDLNEIEADDISFTYEYLDAKILMNINVSGIISSKYYPYYSLVDDGFFDENGLVYQRSSTLIDYSDEKINYYFKVYQYEDQYLLHLETVKLNLYAYTYDNVKDVASKMYMLAKTSNIKKENIIANYSSKDKIDFEKTSINLFETILPVNGMINDLLTE